MSTAEYIVSKMYYINMKPLFTGFVVLSNRPLHGHRTLKLILSSSITVYISVFLARMWIPQGMIICICFSGTEHIVDI